MHETDWSKKSSRKQKSPSGKRLDITAWVDAALQVLEHRGVDGIAIESLARDLGVTKGSFYWHFKNRESLLLEVLHTWRKRSTLLVMERIEQHKAPSDQLESLLVFPLVSAKSTEGANIELAIRMWGSKDPMAKDVLEEVDSLRLRFIEHIFYNLGCSAADAHARAVMAYSFMRVASSLPASIDSRTLAQRVARILIANPETD